MFKKKKGFFSKMLRKAGISSGVTITVISIAAIGTILYGASHFSKAYNDSKFLSELPSIKTPAELLGKAGGNDYNYVGYTNSKSVDNMIKQIKNATPNVGNNYSINNMGNMVGGNTNGGGNTDDSTNNNRNTDNSTNNDGNRIVLYNPDVSGSGNLTQNDKDVLGKTKGYIIFLKSRKFPKELAGLYKYYGYISGYNVYNVKTNGAFVPLTLGDNGTNGGSGGGNNGGSDNSGGGSDYDFNNLTSFTQTSDGNCGSVGDNYGLETGYNNTYSRIIHLNNTEDPDCVYLALHDKDNFASGVEFVLESDLDFSGANMNYTGLNNNLDLKRYKKGVGSFLPIGGDNSAGGYVKFNATFLGNNHRIVIGNINFHYGKDVGFFGYVGLEGKISNLKLKFGNISGSDYIGGFAGTNDGKISYSLVVVDSISGRYDHVGGFVGKNYNGIIQNSSVKVNSSISVTYGYVGGFAGENGDWDGNGKIENSSVVVNSVISNVNNYDYGFAGGFVGHNYNGTIKNSSVKVDFVNSSENNVGGFAGDNYNSGTIENSSVVVNSVSGKKYVGGFVGHNYKNGIISSSSVKVNNFVSGSSNSVGGFVGDNGGGGGNGTIENSSAKVNSVIGYYDVGGFVGWNNDNGIISNSSGDVGSVSDTYNYGNIGGFAGLNKGTISNSFVNVNNANSNKGSGIGGFVGVNYDTGTIENSSVVVDNISGKNSVGGFAGNNENNGIISGSSVDVNIVNGSGNSIGGFVGTTNGGIISYSSGNVNNVSGSSDYVGGFAGYNIAGTIQNSSVKVNNSVNGSNIIVGGFVGKNFNGTIQNSSVKVNNYVSGKKYVGGFVGDNDNWNGTSTIEKSSAKVNFVNGSNNNVGGFAGSNSGIISGSLTNVSYASGNYDVGGFVGHNNNSGKINNSSAVVKTVNGNNQIGGFVGYDYNDNSEYNVGTIRNSSVIVDTVEGNTYNVGGFVGKNYNCHILNSSVVVNVVSGSKYVGGFVGQFSVNYYDNYGIISGSSVVVNHVVGSNYIGGFVGDDWYGKIQKSLAVVNFITDNGDNNSKVGGFVRDSSYYSRISESVARILDLNDNSSIGAGYYENRNHYTSSTNISRDQFFFEDPNGNNNGLEYTGNDGGGTLTITVPADKTFDAGSFNSAFTDGWGSNVMSNLGNFWTNWGN